MGNYNFEEAMRRLEEIVDRLESGELSLEESLALFEEGMKLTQHCSSQLEQARLQVRQLVIGSGGIMGEEPFEAGDSGEENNVTL
ncbi:MAG: exodeoxyribonuclease VII small subunit [Chloroflexi bacterium]|nr:exodeoxyribonuclease VII small subunit [Chloroflexota bacterium]